MSTCILVARLVPSERVGPMPPALRIWTRIRKYAFRETVPRRRLHRHSWCVSGGCRHMLPCNAFAQAMAWVDRPIGSHGRFHSGRWGMCRGVRVRRMGYQRRARVSDLDRGEGQTMQDMLWVAIPVDVYGPHGVRQPTRDLLEMSRPRSWRVGGLRGGRRDDRGARADERSNREVLSDEPGPPRRKGHGGQRHGAAPLRAVTCRRRVLHGPAIP